MLMRAAWCLSVGSKRLIALAAQKFISDIAQDSMQYCKSRMAGTVGTTKERKGKVRLNLGCTRVCVSVRTLIVPAPCNIRRRTSGWC